jgi:phosphoglucomutase
MITFTLEGPATLTLRASGTEPKLKYYLETRDDVALADRLQAAVERELVQPERHGLRLPAQSV